MNLFESILWGLSGKMEIPASFGLFHLTFLALTVILTVFLCVRFGKASAKTEKIILTIIWAVLVVFEIYKQLLYSIQFTDPISWDYPLYSFPFQFCSTPLYVIPFAVFPKSERLRDAVRMFLATYSLFAGAAVMLVPGDVGSVFIGINIQTMTHHGLMAVTGIYLGGRLVREGKMELRLFMRGGVLFGILTATALIADIIVPVFTDELFNMFYISPNYPCTLFFGSWVYAIFPYPVFLLAYLLIFTSAAFLFFLMQKYIRLLWQKRRAADQAQ